MKKICVDCGELREHKGLGFCKRCYGRLGVF